jgi:uncharacterized protein (TIGR00251 family)
MESLAVELIRPKPDRVSLHIRLTPKGGRDAIDGWGTAADGKEYLKVRVAAVPEDGKANAALVALLAKALGVARSGVSILSGHTSRIKHVEISGDAGTLRSRLANLGKAT